jgi:hypothetical protein
MASTIVTNEHGMSLGAARITVRSASWRTANTIDRAFDSVIIAGDLPGDAEVYSLVPATDLFELAESVLGDLSDEDEVRAFLSLPTVKAAAMALAGGARSVGIVKAYRTEDRERYGDDAYKESVHDNIDAIVKAMADAYITGYIVPIALCAEGDVLSDGTYLDGMAAVAAACARSHQEGWPVQAVMRAASTDGTVLVNSEAMRRKQAWQEENCYAPAHGVVPQNDMYRFVAVPAGRCTAFYRGAAVASEDATAPLVAGVLSSLPDDVSIAGRLLPVRSISLDTAIVGPDALSIAGFMPVGTRPEGRAWSERVTALSDRTMGVTGSVYSSETAMRLARRIGARIAIEAERSIGTRGDGAKAAADAVLSSMVAAGTIRSYRVMASRPTDDPSTVLLHS